MGSRKNIVDAFIVRSKNRNVPTRQFSKKEVIFVLINMWKLLHLFQEKVISKIRESLLSDDLVLLEYDALADYKKQEHSSQQVDSKNLFNMI